MAESTLFIPDISGFTKFVKSTEILHSKHIIEELINIIIKNGSDAFQVAEIEGDAVFFYNERKLSAEEVIKIAKKIFIAFHSHISFYEFGRLCNCGACVKAIDLQLKFIVHSGEISLAKFDSQKAKPYGDSVIEAHRLLKNQINEQQYILFSKRFLGDNQSQYDGQGEFDDTSLGKIPFKYLKIDHWKSETLSQVEELQRDDVDIEVESVLEVPMNSDTLYQYISDFRYRHYWSESAEKIIYDEETVNQVGTEHFCVVKGRDLHFNTIRPKIDSNTLAYGEVLKNPSPLKYFETNFLLDPASINTTRVKLIIRASLRWKLQLLILPVFKKKLRQQAVYVLAAIKASIENNFKEIEQELQVST